MKLAVITGSIREGRVSQHISEAILSRAGSLEGATTDHLDLKELNLPMFDEAISPKFNTDRNPTGAVKQWLDALKAADAYVVVSPEYNKSIPGALKNAFDFIAHEVDNKPFALASHGSSNGAYALANLRVVVPELGGYTIPRHLALAYGSYDSEGNFSGDASELNRHIDGMLEQLKQHADALEQIRN